MSSTRPYDEGGTDGCDADEDTRSNCNEEQEGDTAAAERTVIAVFAERSIATVHVATSDGNRR